MLTRARARRRDCRSREGSRRHERENPKRVYYLSLEFMIGRSLANNVMNLLLTPHVDPIATRNRLDWLALLELPAPRTFVFAGKAAPAYRLAKLIIKFVNDLAATIDGDPAVRGRLKVLFLPGYRVTLPERLIPAADVSNQISTAG